MDDLFREEDIPFDIEKEVVNEPQARKSRKFGFVPIALIIAVILSLAYIANLNSKRFYLKVENGMVTVEKGLFFPVGAARFRPNVAYQPFQLPKQLPEFPQGAITAEDRDDVLRVLLIQSAIEQMEGAANESVEKAYQTFMLSHKLDLGGPTVDQQEIVMGRYNMRQMYSNVSKIHELLSMARRNADRARTQGITTADDWLVVIEKALQELKVLAKRDNVDISGSSPTAHEETDEK